MSCEKCRGVKMAPEPYCLAYKCARAACGGWRWADVADSKGETSCIKCGGRFPKKPEHMPFHREGSPSAQGGTEAIDRKR